MRELARLAAVAHAQPERRPAAAALVKFFFSRRAAGAAGGALVRNHGCDRYKLRGAAAAREWYLYYSSSCRHVYACSGRDVCVISRLHQIDSPGGGFLHLDRDEQLSARRVEAHQADEGGEN